MKTFNQINLCGFKLRRCKPITWAIAVARCLTMILAGQKGWAARSMNIAHRIQELFAEARKRSAPARRRSFVEQGCPCPRAARVLSLLGLSVLIFQPAEAASWVTTGSLATARHNHTTTLLPNGKVLGCGRPLPEWIWLHLSFRHRAV